MINRLEIALAACAFELGKVENGQLWVQMTPTGHFKAIDGRPHDVKSWFIDKATAQQVINRFNANKNEKVWDYEHQTLHKEKNGKPAPAAGWIKQLQWREGVGLFALVELTARAAELINNKEYRYNSPVFSYSANTGVVLDILMGAATNNPAIDGMEPLIKLAAATFSTQLNQPTEVKPMDELLIQLRKLLGLAEDATAEQILEALGKLTTKANESQADQVAEATAKISKALGIDEKSSPEQIIASCSALQAQATSNNQDSSKYVPLTAFTELQSKFAALSTKVETDKKQQVIDVAVKKGKLLPSLIGWAEKLSIDDLTAYVTSAPAVAELTQMQTGSNAPDPKNFNLTASELDIARKTGLTAEQYAKAKEQM